MLFIDYQLFIYNIYSIKMIQDYQTNTVYLAQGLRHYMPMYKNLIDALDAQGIEYRFLPKTESKKHVWVRDFMPIQIDKDKFLRYKYHPDYLCDFEDYIPDYLAIDKELNIKCKQTELILDGGNVVKCGEKVIMTDKIFKENFRHDKRSLVNKLENLMQDEIVFIPWDEYEMFGHADGMVRYIKDNKVLINNYFDLDPWFYLRLKDALIGHFEIEDLRYSTPRCSNSSWAYLNFLQTKTCIFVPGLGIKEDQLAVQQIQAAYPNHKIVQIDGCQNLVLDGGALNCVSWNILTC